MAPEKLSSHTKMGKSVKLVCPSCDVMFTNNPSVGFQEWQIHSCPNCGRKILTQYDSRSGDGSLSDGRIVYPYRQAKGLENVTQKEVVYNFDQALRSYSARAFNAAAVMARATVEVICLDLGATGKNLQAKLENLRDTQKITPRVWEWADTIRLWGNDTVHDFPEIQEDEADYLLRFTWELIEHVYIKEAEFQAIKHPKSQA